MKSAPLGIPTPFIGVNKRVQDVLDQGMSSRKAAPRVQVLCRRPGPKTNTPFRRLIEFAGATESSRVEARGGRVAPRGRSSSRNGAEPSRNGAPSHSQRIHDMESISKISFWTRRIMKRTWQRTQPRADKSGAAFLLLSPTSCPRRHLKCRKLNIALSAGSGASQRIRLPRGLIWWVTMSSSSCLSHTSVVFSAECWILL